MGRIAFLGGTGPEGLGLALRFALAGEHVIIGSRQRERAQRAADGLRARLNLVTSAAQVAGDINDAAAQEADIVALTLPFASVAPLLSSLAATLAGKIILDVVNPLCFSDGVFTLLPVPAGSAGELIQKLLPQAAVVSGFKNLSAKELWDTEHPLHGDVLLCSNHPQATQHFVNLIHRVPQLRPIDAGVLANARSVENIAALLLNLNRHYHAVTSIQVLGL